MNKTPAQNPESVRAGGALPTSSYRPALALAFLACFLSLLVVSSGWFEQLQLLMEVRVIVGIFIPVLAATAILYPSVLFRDRRPAFRMGTLIAFGFVLLILAFALLAAFGLLLVVFGIISPE